MASVVVQVADAVVAELVRMEPAIAAVRQYVPEYSVAKEKGLVVLVVPAAVAMERADRIRYQHEVSIDVGVYQYIADETTATLDALMAKVQSIADFLAAADELFSMPRASLMEIGIRPIYVRQEIKENRVFESVIRLVYLVI